MASVVGGFLLPHDPMILTMPDAPPQDVADRVRAAYGEIGRRIAALDATTVLVIGTDHYVLFGPGCLPQFAIATGDVDGPIERLPGLERRTLPTNAPLAQHIAAHGHRNGLDWAVAPTFTADHSVVLPYELIREGRDLPLIPVYLACGVQPLIPLPRARQVGAAIRSAVESWPGDDRVVVVGSGGISHWVGTAEMGAVSPEFDRALLELIEEGDIDTITSMDDDDILARAGNGALEVRNFVAAMAAVGPCRGDVIAYEAVPEWITGLGFAELRPVAPEREGSA